MILIYHQKPETWMWNEGLEPANIVSSTKKNLIDRVLTNQFTNKEILLKPTTKTIFRKLQLVVYPQSRMFRLTGVGSRSSEFYFTIAEIDVVLDDFETHGYWKIIGDNPSSLETESISLEEFAMLKLSGQDDLISCQSWSKNAEKGN